MWRRYSVIHRSNGAPGNAIVGLRRTRRPFASAFTLRSSESVRPNAQIKFPLGPVSSRPTEPSRAQRRARLVRPLFDFARPAFFRWPILAATPLLLRACLLECAVASLVLRISTLPRSLANLPPPSSSAANAPSLSLVGRRRTALHSSVRRRLPTTTRMLPSTIVHNGFATCAAIKFPRMRAK